MDENERYQLGEFADCASAVAACKRIVDEFFATCNPGSTEDELVTQYAFFGEDPWISSDDSGCRFSARDYARERAKELARKKGA
jgi:hypothetical protein